MKIIDIIWDDRIAATSVLLDMTFAEYQRLAMGAEQNLDIQEELCVVSNLTNNFARI